MRNLLISLFMLIFAITVMAADSALVAAAKKEKARRQQNHSAKIITNEDVQKFIERKKAAGEIPEDSNAVEENGINDSDSIEYSTEFDRESYKYNAMPLGNQPGPLNNEAYWRGRKSSLEDQIRRVEQEISDISSHLGQLHMNGLTEVGDDPKFDSVFNKEPRGGIKIYGHDTPTDSVNLFAVESQLKAKQAELERLRGQFDVLEEEARRAGALPGWLRD